MVLPTKARSHRFGSWSMGGRRVSARQQGGSTHPLMRRHVFRSANHSSACPPPSQSVEGVVSSASHVSACLPFGQSEGQLARRGWSPALRWSSHTSRSSGRTLQPIPLRQSH